MATEPLLEPDWTALSALLPGRTGPLLPERIAGSEKTSVYRLPGAGRGGSPVIAKLCRLEVASVERIVYEEVLPRLPLASPAYYGTAAAGEGWSFILLEEIRGAKYTLLSEEHRALAGRWLGVLHSGARALAPLSGLPERGPAHYLQNLRSGRERLLSALANGTLGARDRALVEAVARQCDRIELVWPRIEDFCAGLPVTLVHGDFRPKNVRVREDVKGRELVPMDWETAGWGVPAADLAASRGSPHHPLVDLAAYEETVRDTLGLEGATLRRLALLGSVFRRLSAIDWAALSFETPWPEKALACLEVYQAELEEVLVAPPWVA